MKDLLSAPDDFRKLRVFEDLSRKGAVVIHGLEEITVKNTFDILSILDKGSKKKQMAATKLNEMSRFNIYRKILVVLIVYSL